MAEEEKNGKRIVYVGDLGKDTSKDVILGLLGFDMESQDPIRMIVNSCGGYIDEMFAIYAAMQACRAPIGTIGIGKIMSTGVLILAAGAKGERRMASNARVMIHELSGGVYGKLYQMETDLEGARELQRRMERALAKTCGRKVGEIRALMETHKDTYITAATAKAFGIVDRVVG